jgi:hypothetical protein
MKKSAARAIHYNKLEKPRVTCFCCSETFEGNQVLDGHLQRKHPEWFESTLRKIHLLKTAEHVAGRG